MKKNTTTRRYTREPSKGTKSFDKQFRPLLGIGFAILAVITAVSFIDYTPEQSYWTTTRALAAGTQLNLFGQIGASIAFWSSYCLGFAIWLLPIFATRAAFAYISGRAQDMGWFRYLAMGVGIVSFAGFLNLVQFELLTETYTRYFNPDFYPMGPGGILGQLIYAQGLHNPVGLFGSAVLLLGSFVASTTYAFMSFSSAWALLKKLAPAIQKLGQMAPGIVRPFGAMAGWMRERLSTWQAQRAAKAEAKKAAEAALPSKKEAPIAEPAVAEPEPEVMAVPEPAPVEVAPVAAEEAPVVRILASEGVEKASPAEITKKRGRYIFPPLDLLEQAQPNLSGQREDPSVRMQSLIQTLTEFGVKANPSEIQTGPVITRYEVTPAAGVRVEKIANLDKNIALALKAISVRIQAPVPGKGSVGIEIPNLSPDPVCLREIIESKAWVDSDAQIPIVLGKEVTGKPLIADLTKMPHLLIAGSTGAGKTVCINAIVASLLYHASPDDVRFLMVDPKIVEMQVYNDLPHMLNPVVTDPKRVPGALKWLLAEMEHRYQVFAKAGVRNIAGFNAKIAKSKAAAQEEAELTANLSAEERTAMNSMETPSSSNTDDFDLPKEKLPYIVCIVDELADLMMVAPADIETCIARLAQLARAAGIHLIIATQRPSVNVITGVIKANLPSRISFRVASKVDSRTILDMGGADQLIGRGDMLFIPPGSSTLIRAQGAFVSDDEINAIVEASKKNGPPAYIEDVETYMDTDGNPAAAALDGEDWEDDMIPQALAILQAAKKPSTSMLQRRLRIGYNRAARIVDILQDKGLIQVDSGNRAAEPASVE